MFNSVPDFAFQNTVQVRQILGRDGTSENRRGTEYNAAKSNN